MPRRTVICCNANKHAKEAQRAKQPQALIQINASFKSVDLPAMYTTLEVARFVDRGQRTPVRSCLDKFHVRRPHHAMDLSRSVEAERDSHERRPENALRRRAA